LVSIEVRVIYDGIVGIVVGNIVYRCW